jgi:hypothetical protein
MNAKLTTILAIGFANLAIGANANAAVNLLTDPSFAQAAYQTPATDVPGWSVQPGEDTYTQITNDFGTCYEGQATCFYTKTGANVLSQTFSDTAGETLTIGAAIRSQGPDVVQVLFDGQAVLTENFSSATNWAIYSAQLVTATGWDTISFVTPASNWTAVEYDNTFAAGAPEPTTWAMMMLGFGGLGFAGRRSYRKVTVAA